MTQHTDFASPATAPVHDPWSGTMARSAEALAPAAQPVDNSVTPPSLALHARQVAVHPVDVLPASEPAEVDHAFHPYPLPISAAKAASRVPHPGIGLDVAQGAAQLAALAHSKARLDRARSYAAHLADRLAEARAKLSAASACQVGAVIGTTAADPVDLWPLRGEAIELDRLQRQALAIQADVEAEHARHEADAAALFGSDGAARAKLAEAHVARDTAQTTADKAKSTLDRARAHAQAVGAKLDAARTDEARHDADATARLRAALANGDALPVTADPLVRASPGLEDDLRAASAAVDALLAEHAGKAAALIAADLVVKGAVDAVLCAEAEAVARELMAADARTLALRVRLHCYANRRASDWVAPVAGPPKVHVGGWMEADPAAYALPPAIRTTAVIGTAIASAPAPQSGGMVSARWANEDEAWNRYAAALAFDPEAEASFADGSPTPSTVSLPAFRAA